VEFTCEETLETVLPALLRRNPGAVADGSIVQFIVPDQQACRYFYTFRQKGVVVDKGLSDRVDLTLSLVSEDLGRFLDATLDFEHAVRTQRMKVMGDAELLLALASALAGPRA
jgi:alkyl sulfatase BDS1-like metallo-beta-lactamase superfamily hydrolase